MVLKCYDAVLFEVKPNLTYDVQIKLQIAPIFSALQLFLPDLVSKATEKSDCVLHDEAIQKLLSVEKKHHSPSASWSSSSKFATKDSLQEALGQEPVLQGFIG